MEQLVPSVPGVLGFIVAIYVAVSNRRTAKAASEVQQAAAAINGYRDLCAALQLERDRLSARLENVERELAHARSLVLPLEARVAQLEAERDTLIRRLALMEESNGRKRQRSNGHTPSPDGPPRPPKKPSKPR